MSSIKQILAASFLLTSSFLVKADYSSGSGSGSSYDNSYGSGSGSGSGGYAYNNQGNQAITTTSYYGGGFGGRGGGDQSLSNGWGQSSTAIALIETTTMTMTETMMATTTVTESVTESCSSSEGGWSSSMPASPPMFSPPGTVSVQIVRVSDNNGTLAYSPDNIVAEPGTRVEFIFYPKNHTVTQSSFAAPCVPIGVSTPNATTPEAPGIKSGFVPVQANATDFLSGIRPSFGFIVNDTKPIWLYCGQPGHCQKGMAMVINQNMTDSVHTLENYKQAAAQLPLPDTSSSAPAGGPPGAPAYGASTSTSTFTQNFPPPEVTSSAVAPAASPIVVTTSAGSPASLTSSASGVGIFTGAAVALKGNGMHARAAVGMAAAAGAMAFL